MTGYRHINLLVNMTTYLELRELCRKIERPCSEIVRESIWNTIGSLNKEVTGTKENQNGN